MIRPLRLHSRFLSLQSRLLYSQRSLSVEATAQNGSESRLTTEQTISEKEMRAGKEREEKSRAQASSPPMWTPHSMMKHVDIRVGRIVHIEPHPNAEKLYVSQVDVGGELGKSQASPSAAQPPTPKATRQILSGLRGILTEQDLLGKLVLVVCNMPKRKLRGLVSEGMLLCATDRTNETDTTNMVKLVECHSSALPGDRVVLSESTGELSSEPIACAPKRVLETALPLWTIDERGFPSMQGYQWTLERGGDQTIKPLLDMKGASIQ